MYNICIDEIRFEWNEEKNLINQEKHGVAFVSSRKATETEKTGYERERRKGL